MKQILQSLSTGDVIVTDVPAPTLKRGHVLVRTTQSLVSPGTERMLRDFGKASLLGKALQQRDRVRDVLVKARTDGLVTTIEAVRAKLDQPIPLGYSNVGQVISVPSDVTGLAIGDRVISNGPHAEIIRVPVNLVARIPDGVGDDQACFTVLGAIALQGIRLLAPTFGECIVVTGLGLIGLLAVQLLRAQGVRVLGIDMDEGRCALARQFGAETVCLKDGEDPLSRAVDFSRGRGVDGVLICATTSSNEPIEQAAQMSRQRGRVVLVGVVGLDLPRDAFYRKELTFQVSCSYGPGRYDSAYEDSGLDYPIGFVRWTEKRNFEAVLDAFADRRLDVSAFISRRYSVEQAAEAYSNLDAGGSILGIMLTFPQVPTVQGQNLAAPAVLQGPIMADGQVRIGMIGAGNYASRQLAPAFQNSGGTLMTVCSGGGVSSAYVRSKFGFLRTAPDAQAVLDAPDIDLVVVATRHDSHASLVQRALKAGKAVFVEKPLAMTAEDIKNITVAVGEASRPFLMVGFNRRFSRYITPLRKAISAASAPAAIIMTINAGKIPSDHWTQDRVIGGGRVIGEVCHFIDLARCLAGAPINLVEAHSLGRTAGDSNPEDKAFITLGFENGCVASIQYLANGHKTFPKERVEVFFDGKIWRVDNFRRLEGFGAPSIKAGLFGSQDKGQENMAAAVVKALRTGQAAPISLDELIEVAECTILADRLLRGA